jgi:hypothetical protein
LPGVSIWRASARPSRLIEKLQIADLNRTALEKCRNIFSLSKGLTALLRDCVHVSRVGFSWPGATSGILYRRHMG